MIPLPTSWACPTAHQFSKKKIFTPSTGMLDLRVQGYSTIDEVLADKKTSSLEHILLSLMACDAFKIFAVHPSLAHRAAATNEISSRSQVDASCEQTEDDPRQIP